MEEHKGGQMCCVLNYDGVNISVWFKETEEKSKFIAVTNFLGNNFNVLLQALLNFHNFFNNAVMN